MVFVKALASILEGLSGGLEASVPNIQVILTLLVFLNLMVVYGP